MKPGKKQKSDAQIHRQLWWAIFSVALLLLVMDLIHAVEAAA